MMIWTTGDDGFSNPPNRRRFWRAPRVVLVDPSRGRCEGGRPRGGRGRMRGAARRVVFRYDAIDAEGPRGWGVATRVARAREETRGTERDKKRPARSAREEEETEASSDRWSPSGSPRWGVARTFVCLGNRANPPSSNCSPPPSAAVIVSRSPRRRGADRRRYHVGTVECTREEEE